MSQFFNTHLVTLKFLANSINPQPHPPDQERHQATHVIASTLLAFERQIYQQRKGPRRLSNFEQTTLELISVSLLR